MYKKHGTIINTRKETRFLSPFGLLHWYASERRENTNYDGKHDQSNC